MCDLTAYPTGFRHRCDRHGCWLGSECFPNWAPLEGAFGRPNVKPSDIDGVVEIRGYFLWIEWKGTDAPLSGGQAHMYRALLKQNRDLGRPAHAVAVVTLRPPRVVTEGGRRAQVWLRLGTAPGDAMTLESEDIDQDLRTLCQRWTSWVRSRR